MKMMMIRFCSVRQKFPHSADFQARGARGKWETRKMHLNSNSVWLLLLSNSIHRFASQKLLLLLLLLLWLLAGSDWDIPNSCSDFECGWWPSWRQTWRHKPPLRLCVVLSLRRIAMDAARVSSLKSHCPTALRPLRCPPSVCIGCNGWDVRVPVSCMLIILEASGVNRTSFFSHFSFLAIRIPTRRIEWVKPQWEKL